MKISEYKTLLKKPKKSKLSNQKTNGYHSKKEARRATQLKLLEKSGVICDLQEQVSFVLLESFKDSSGKHERGIKYIADFTYKENRYLICEETKGFWTRDAIIKRKLFKMKYPEYIFRTTPKKN
jgi:hypothetical protein